jgi:hypothetical protein
MSVYPAAVGLCFLRVEVHGMMWVLMRFPPAMLQGDTGKANVNAKWMQETLSAQRSTGLL